MVRNNFVSDVTLELFGAKCPFTDDIYQCQKNEMEILKTVPKGRYSDFEDILKKISDKYRMLFSDPTVCSL